MTEGSGRSLRTALLETLGAVMLALAFIGIFMPVLPTTPFVLAAAFCFSANPRMYARIRDSPYFGEYLRSYKEGTPISRSTRAKGIALTWVVLAVSIALLQENWIRTLLAVIGVCVTIHLLLIGRPGAKA